MSDYRKDAAYLMCQTVVAFMQATGMVNDHVAGCFRCEDVRTMGAS